MTIIFLLHLFTTFFMCGVCWFVQIVHYPLFREIRKEDFPNYEKKNFVTGYVTVPVMTLELFSGLWILYFNYNTPILVNMLLLSLIWASTFHLQVPLHFKLTKKANPDHIAKLVRTNWIRTIGWTLRSLLLSYYVLTGFHIVEGLQ